MADLPREDVVALERIEVEACRSWTGAAPESVASELGIGLKALGSALAVRASRIDVLAYNRVLGLGVESPAREADLDLPGWRHWAAFDGEEPVSFGALYVRGDLGWLGFASTRPTHRKQEMQSALIATRLRVAADLGCRLLSVETADDTPETPNASTHNLMRLGFRAAYRRPNWVLKPAL